MGNREQEVTRLPAGDDPPRQRLGSILNRLLSPFRRGKAPALQMAMGFYTDTSVCIGCKACEVACKQWNQLPSDGFEFTGNSYDNTGELSATSWRHVKFVEQLRETPSPAPRFSLDLLQQEPSPIPPSVPSMDRWLMMSDVCKHCATAPCEQACPTGALIYNEFANVYVQSEICNGCAYCVAACPFGVVVRSEFDGHAHKCTLCYDRQKDGLVPACAKACPTASIQFGPLDQLRQRAQQRVKDLQARGVAEAYLYGDTSTETYSQLNSFYLLVDRPEVYGLPEKPFNPWLHMPGDYARAVVSGLLTLAALLAAVFLSGG